MKGNCQVKSTRPIREILFETPRGQVAMFAIISAPCTVDESNLGERVYIKNSLVYSFMSGKPIKGLAAENLHFMRYVDEANIN